MFRVFATHYVICVLAMLTMFHYSLQSVYNVGAFSLPLLFYSVTMLTYCGDVINVYVS